MTLRKTTTVSLSLLSVAALAACTQVADPTPVSPDQEAAPAPVTLDTPSIVATTSILGNIAQQIAVCVADKEGAVSGHVRTLLPIGTDPHDFQPSSEQVAAMEAADIVIANGLNLEESLSTVFQRLDESGANLWLTAEWIDPLEFAGLSDDDGHGHGHGHGDDHGDSHGDEDPHYWLDMNRMVIVSVELGSRLANITGDPTWADCANQVAASITEAEQRVIGLFDQIDTTKRVIITDHDAFAYLANRYNFDIAGVVIPGGSTLAEATSADLARLVADVDARGITALIGNIHQPNRLLDALAEESRGTLTVVPIYVESVGEVGSPAADYQGMMIWNAQQIVEALQD
jgi:zinc/manganese transport system substrate-binding protein